MVAHLKNSGIWEMKLEKAKFMVLERVLLRLYWGDAEFCCAAAFSSRDNDAFEVHFLTQSQSQTWINDLPTPSIPNKHLRIRLRMLQCTWRKFSYTLNNSLEICHCSWQDIWVFSGYVYNRYRSYSFNWNNVCLKHRHRGSIFKAFPQKRLFKNNILKSH